MTDQLDDGTDVTGNSVRALVLRALNHAMVAQSLAERNARQLDEHARMIAEMAAEAARLRDNDLRLAESLGTIGRELGEIRTILQDLVRMVVTGRP